jgi:hypothetical protein
MGLFWKGLRRVLLWLGFGGVVDFWWGLVGVNGPRECTLESARLHPGLLALPNQGGGGSTQKSLSKSKDSGSTLPGGELLWAVCTLSKGQRANMRILEGLKVGLSCAFLQETVLGGAHLIDSLGGGFLKNERKAPKGQRRSEMSLFKSTTITVGLYCALTGDTILAILRRGGCWPSIFYHHRGGGGPGRDHAGMPAGG